MATLPTVISASYNDSARLGWWSQLESLDIPHVLYHKDDTLAHGDEHVVSPTERKIANFGKSDYAFLHHIVNHYNDLADHTIFVKANWSFLALCVLALVGIVVMAT